MKRRTALLTTLAATAGPLAGAQHATAAENTKCASNGRVWACTTTKATSNRVTYVSTYTARAPGFDGKADDGAVEYRISMLDKAGKEVRTWPAYDWFRRKPSQLLDDQCTWYFGDLSWTNSWVPCVAWPDGYMIRTEVNVPGQKNNPVSAPVRILK